MYVWTKYEQDLELFVRLDEDFDDIKVRIAANANPLQVEGQEVTAESLRLFKWDEYLPDDILGVFPRGANVRDARLAKDDEIRDKILIHTWTWYGQLDINISPRITVEKLREVMEKTIAADEELNPGGGEDIEFGDLYE